MKILLIKPKWFVKGGLYSIQESIKFTPLNLGILAALSEGHEVTAVDGDWDEIPYDRPFDLVGITVSTFTSQQAYDIAGKFMAKGAKVVMGGAHPSILPEECLEHTDSVVVGEVEYVWKDLLADVQAGTLKKIYKNDKPVDMNDVPFPRRDLLGDNSWVACVQATRGCPNKCVYCYLQFVQWGAYRKRNIDLVIKELESIKQKVIYIVDDNLFADLDYAMELFDRMVPLKKLFSIQAPTTIAKNKKLLEKMSRAGCFHVQMGFQSPNPKSLEWADISHNNLAEYKNIVTAMHRHGMLVSGFLIAGFDTDDKTIFDQIEKMAVEIDLDDSNLYILTPYPGSKLYQQFKNEGRLLEHKRDRLNFGWANATFQPKQMSAEELEKGVQRTISRLAKHYKRKLAFNVLRFHKWLLLHPRVLYAVAYICFTRRDIRKNLVSA
jgi:radical SAM superfamily enzyme YgiQ (UPF0313 family)